MSWSWRIGRIAGIDVYMHFTFLILLAWVGFMHYSQRGSLADAAYGVFFIAVLFGIVVLHELGHALAARRYGIKTRDITLLPIGGVARLERIPEDPRQELVVAVAGPAVNVVMAVGLLAGIMLGRGMAGFDRVLSIGGSFIDQIFWVNVALVLFNILPAFPMDGGRVLRALLAMRMDYVRATQTAAMIGQGMAVLFAIAGLFLNPLLLFIALFVWVGASQEAAMVQMRSALSGIPVGRAMITNFRTLSPQDPIKRAVEYTLEGFQQDFPVVENGRPVGVLTRNDLITGLSSQGPDGVVADVMQKEFETVDPREMLDGVFTRLQTCNCQSMPVVRGSELVGLITVDNLAELMMIDEALRTSRAALRTVEV